MRSAGTPASARTRTCSSAPVPASQWVWIGTPVRRWAAAAARKIGRSRGGWAALAAGDLDDAGPDVGPRDDRARRSRARRSRLDVGRRTGPPARPRTRGGSSATARRTARGGGRSRRRAGRRVRRDSSASFAGLRPQSAGIASIAVRRPAAAASRSSVGHAIDVGQEEVRRQLDRPAAVDDEVLVGVGDAQLGRGRCRRARSGRSVTRPPPATTDDDRPAAVDLQQLAGHGPRLVGQEVDRGVGDLVGIHHLAGERLLARGEGADPRVAGCPRRHRRVASATARRR